MSIGLVYFEKQEGALCAVHCLNTLLQYPVFNAVDLARIAVSLDEKERLIMGEKGYSTREFLEFVVVSFFFFYSFKNISNKIIQIARFPECC